MQALLIHGFQLLDMWINHLAVKNSDCQRSKFLDSMTAGRLFSGVMLCFSIRARECIPGTSLVYWNSTSQGKLLSLDRLTAGMEGPPQP